MFNEEHIAFCSGGKDSVATLIVAKENGEPLDAVAFAEVMFDKQTSGEHPLHREFVYDKLKPFVERELKVPFIVLHSDRTYTDVFFHTISKGKGEGKTHGFPLPMCCAINRDCKMRPIRQFRKQTGKATEYVGIAIDEPIRLKRLEGTNRISLLQKYSITENEALSLCASYGMLSPIYDISKRNGCWFCMNCSDNEFLWLMQNAPSMFDKLLQLERTENLYRRCLTRTETPSQLKARLDARLRQITFF